MQQDCVVVGASFAGLACATALAGAGARVTVLERKHDPGVKLHTTGILVRDLVEQLPLLDGLNERPPVAIEILAAIDELQQGVVRAAAAHGVAQQVDLLAQGPHVVHDRSGQSFGIPEGMREKKPQFGSTVNRVLTVRVPESMPITSILA